MPTFNPAQISSEFAERVKGAHTSRGYSEPGFSATAVEAMTPEEHAYTLHHAAEVQRDVPEKAMRQVQSVTRGGAFSHLAEHVGDLSHRLNEQGGAFGAEFVRPKVEMALGVLRNRADVNDMRRTLDKPEVRKVGEQYADAHRTVPVYNKPSDQARSAAVALGRGNFSAVETHLKGLHRSLSDSEQFSSMMSQQGSVKHLRAQEEQGMR